jgi:hypothetical protein
MHLIEDLILKALVLDAKHGSWTARRGIRVSLEDFAGMVSRFMCRVEGQTAATVSFVMHTAIGPVEVRPHPEVNNGEYLILHTDETGPAQG